MKNKGEKMERKTECVKICCTILGISKSGYYKKPKVNEDKAKNEKNALQLVRKQRKSMPRVGGRKLYHTLKSELQHVGRDKFFRILRENDLLIERKRKYCRTTNSMHRFKVHKNLKKQCVLTAPEQCWVADMTYLNIGRSFGYLSLLTDAFSRKIVGWYLSQDMKMEGPYRALQMALKQRQSDTPLIHHSDRGIQYCSKEYVNLQKMNNIATSMTEENHCYENALAERMNGILKQEFLLDATFPNFKACHRAVKQAISTYNRIRPHLSLDYDTPEVIHNLLNIKNLGEKQQEFKAQLLRAAGAFPIELRASAQ